MRLDTLVETFYSCILDKMINTLAVQPSSLRQVLLKRTLQCPELVSIPSRLLQSNGGSEIHYWFDPSKLPHNV